MQVQAYEGYVEGNRFYPTEKPLSVSGRFLAVLTVIDAPVQVENRQAQRMEWLNRLEEAVANSSDEELPDWPFERSKEMRPPLDFAD